MIDFEFIIETTDKETDGKKKKPKKQKKTKTKTKKTSPLTLGVMS